MKTKICCLVVLTMILVGCKDSAEVRSALGTYSYKISGTIQVDSLPEIAYKEQGTLEIISLQDKDSVLLTFNELLGGVYVAHASIEGGEIKLCPFERVLSYSQWIDPITVQVNGSGQVYDGSVVLAMNCQTQEADKLHILARELLLIAKKNK